MMRDVLAQRIPVVLKADVYAVVSAGGALITYITWYEAGLAPAYWSGFFFVLVGPSRSHLFSMGSSPSQTHAGSFPFLKNRNAVPF